MSRTSRSAEGNRARAAPGAYDGAMQRKLPLLVSVPHGGDLIPEEISDKIVLTRHDVFWDSDACTRQIYDVADCVEAFIDTPIARAGVDLNRAEEDLPPGNPDGIVKQKTCLAVDLYDGGVPPSQDDTRVLIEKYYRPYHRRLQELCERDTLTLALDCHSMLSAGPAIGPDPGVRRPLLCISNRDGQTCSPNVLRDAGEIFARAFGLDAQDVGLNAPFKGGYITRKYGKQPLPWIQVEMNRDLYLSPEWFDAETLEVEPARLAALNEMFRQALTEIAELELGGG